MKTKKMPAGKACFPTGYFLSFSPDALHPAGGGTPPARGGGRVASNSQSFNRSFAKMCVRDSPFHRETVCVKQIANSGFGSRGDAPCGVQGQSPAGLLKHHRETVCLIQIVISGERVQG
ncbi:MAG: hypothetical protein IKJ51_02230 [Clostridia bacterium]|nr:hypothetical protein [Clostridia bacterium]MBR6810515.1 hypothetical protein [Clostridia bacterium]